ncbi:MAG: acyl-CoA thioesterase domain-containing protein, partial [Herbaspirillum sp.]
MPDQSLYNTDTILELLQLEALGNDHFCGQSHFMGSPRVFGGQVLGQSLYAAASTLLSTDRRVHSMHALFILAGNHRLPIDYEVERVRDGGSFSTRRVVASQEGRRIFVMSASFQQPEEGLSHQKAAPPSVNPNNLVSSAASLQKEKASSRGREPQPTPVEFRTEDAGGLYDSRSNQSGKQFWVRAPQPLPDNPLLHEALFAYVSDYGLLWTALQSHDIRIGDPRLQIASL